MMKATGIIRKIDDLGRVVIPKEVRRTMRIREGDSLEIFITNDGNGVTFQKHSLLGPLEELCTPLANAFYGNTGSKIIITDYEKVIAFDGFSPSPTIRSLGISWQLYEFLENNIYPSEDFEDPVIEQPLANRGWEKVSYVYPVCYDGDLICGIVLLDCKVDDTIIKALDFMVSVIKSTLNNYQ